MTLVLFQCGHRHEAPAPDDPFVRENMMDSEGMLVCPDCKHLPVMARRRYGWCSLPEIGGGRKQQRFSLANLGLRDLERFVVWGIEPKPVKIELDFDMPDRRELRDADEILALYRRERDLRSVASSDAERTSATAQGGDK